MRYEKRVNTSYILGLKIAGGVSVMLSAYLCGLDSNLVLISSEGLERHEVCTVKSGPVERVAMFCFCHFVFWFKLLIIILSYF